MTEDHVPQESRKYKVKYLWKVIHAEALQIGSLETHSQIIDFADTSTFSYINLSLEVK